MQERYLVQLDQDERKELSQLVKQEKIAAKKRTHAHVLLLADCGRHGPAWKDESIAEACRGDGSHGREPPQAAGPPVALASRD